MIIPYLLFMYVKSSPNLDVLLNVPTGHFYVVSSVAILAAVIAVAVGIAGTRLRNIKVLFLSLSFLSLASAFAVHGLSTPNFLLHATHLPGVTAPLSVILATFWLGLSSLPTDHPAVAAISKYEKLLLPVWAGLALVLGTTAMFYPGLVSFVALSSRQLSLVVCAAVTLVNVFVIFRYYRSYLYSRFPLQLSIVYSAGWLIVSQWIMTLGEMWRISWWMYHFLLLASVIGMLVGLIRQYAESASLVGAVRALYTTDPVERITSCLSPSIKALMVATEKKDLYTAGHNFRVTLYALQLAEELRLGPDQLRAVAQGTIIHDVGKINIPDDILNKPGRLTPEERTVIEQHPVKGYEMARSLGFMKEELGIIRWHHERWDGGGYPDRLRGAQIPLMARIVAVADVYDALTSNRSYRRAMTHAEAIAFLIDNKGSHFDPVVVEAWVQLCGRNPSLYPYPSHLTSEQTTQFVLAPVAKAGG
ncbi:HD-GYP domain-containing protein [Paenibacillus solanacearum]|nr:HD-GYP domain-containing protein [Paenibacillus solanacearum]